MSLETYKKVLAETLGSIDDSQNIAALRLLCRTDLYFLLRYGLNRSDVEDEWLFQRCKEVEANPDGYLDLWSRDHYKSTIITYAKTIQDILASHGDDPLVAREVTVGIFSHTRPIAKGFLRQIMRDFEGNPQLKEWFPDILYESCKQSPKWSEDDGIIVKRKGNPKECTVEAWGIVDSQPISKHFNVLVYDDVVTRDSVNTPEMIAKTNEMLELSYALGTKGGVRRFIGTRYHFNDSYNMLMARGTVIPRLYPATEDGSPNGKPVFLTQKDLDDKRRDMGTYSFSCQMLQRPVADESQGFQREWIKYYDNINYSKMNVYILCDSANSKKKGSDYTSMWVIGLGPDKNYYVIDIIRDKLNLTQRARMYIDLHRKYKPHPKGCRYEKYGMMGDIDHIKTVMEEECYRFEITEVGGSLNKNDRIKRLIPLFEQGRFYFPRRLHKTGHDGKTLDLVSVFIDEEYCAFPVALFDDLMDGLSRIAEPDIPLFWPRVIKNNGLSEGRVNTGIKIW